MYIPSYFQLNDLNEIQRIVVENSLGILVTKNKSLDANHIPFFYDPSEGEMGVLTAHVARANPLWKDITDNDALIIFRGVQTYVSPNWYPSKHETHRKVPTWNYEAVHMHGKLTIHDDKKFILGVIGRLTKNHEAQEPKPWKMSDAPKDYMNMLLKEIVGIQITITKVEAKAKLNQNAELRDREGVIKALEQNEKRDIAQAMKRHI